MSATGNGFGRRTPLRDNPVPQPDPGPAEPAETAGPSLSTS